jgi:hypothetical protein
MKTTLNLNPSADATVEVLTPVVSFNPMNRQKEAVKAALRTMQGLTADEMLRVFRDAAFEAARKDYSGENALHEVAVKLLAASETVTAKA